MDARKIHAATLADGGSSTDLLGSEPVKGYMVSIYQAKGLIVEPEDFTPELVSEYVANHVEILGREDHYLGTWTDAGNVYLDISLNVADLIEALAIGRRHRQIAIYSVEEQESIKVI